MTFTPEGHYEISDAGKNFVSVSESPVSLPRFNDFLTYDKGIAGMYVSPLLDEGILKVTKDHVQIMELVIPRRRVVLFHIALCQLRSPESFFPIAQGANGFTVEKVLAARGNDIIESYRITSNAEDKGSIILTKRLAWELWEVVAFFIPKPEATGNDQVTAVDTDDESE